MLGFWAADPRRSDIPGLTSYLTATFGDAVALPILSASLVLANDSRLIPRRDDALAVGAALVGLVLGASTQVLWLSDPHPQLNWTLPAPGHFTAAGWWHATFLTAYCGFIGGQLGTLVGRIQRKQQIPPLGFIGSLASASIFAVLLVMDNASTLSASSSRATLWALVAGAGLLTAGALAAVFRRHR